MVQKYEYFLLSLYAMTKECKWIVREPADAAKVDKLSAEVGIDRVLADLLVKRGVETFEQARSFFRPSLDDLHDPFPSRTYGDLYHGNLSVP